MNKSLKIRFFWWSLCLLAANTVFGQNATPELNITLGEQRVIFASTRSFQEMRLEVVNSVGEIVFTHFTTEAEFDWNLRQGNSEALAPGLYRYKLALKFSEDQSRHHTGHFIVEKGQDQIWLTANDGAEISGTVLNTARSAGRTIAGVRRGEDGTANRAVTDRTVASESPKQMGEVVKEAAKASTAAPLTFIPDDLTVAGNLSFTNGFADIKTGNNTGGLRFYGAPTLDFIPQAAAIQFWGNASGLPGQLYLDSGAHNDAALIFRTTTTGQQILERMRVTATGNVGIGTTFPSAKLHLLGNAFDDVTFKGTRIGAGSTFSGPTGTGSGEALAILEGSGHSGSWYTFGRAQVRLITTEAWSNTANGTKIDFFTTANGTTDNLRRMTIDHDGEVGIGTSSPDTALHVDGDENNGTSATLKLTSGSQNMLLDGNEIDSLNSGLFLNHNSTQNVVIATGGGSVGIGTTAPDQLLSVNGNASKTSGTSWAVFSDERLKHIRGKYTPGLGALLKLQPIRFEYKTDNALGLKATGETVGFSAQAVAAVLPEAVTQTESGYLQLNSDPILWTMLNSIKEQQAQIQQLTQANQRLQTRLKTVERALVSKTLKP